MRFLLRPLVCALMMAAVTLTAQAQRESKQISGTVTSDLGTVVSGVRVCVKGGGQCAETDAEGRYGIKAQEGDVLVFTSDGFTTTEKTVGDSDELDAQMVVEDLFAINLEDLMNTQIQSSSFLSLTAKEAPGYTFSFDLGDHVSQQSLIDLIKMVIPAYSDGSHTDCEIFGVRGMKVVDNSKSIVMYDGQNLNMRSNVGYGVGLNSMLLGDVKGLEVSLGPNAIVHGSGAISGYINMLPKNGHDNKGFTINVNKEFEHNALNQKSGISKAEIGYGFGSQKRNAYFYAGWYYSNGWNVDSAFYSKVEPGSNYGQTLSGYTFGSTPRANIRLSGNANFDDFNVQIAYTQASRSVIPAKKLSDTSYGLTDGSPIVNFTRQMNSRIKWGRDINDYEHITVSVSNELSDLAREKEGNQFGGAESHLEAKFVASTKRIHNNQLAIGGLVGGRKFYSGKYYFGHDVDYVSIAENNDFIFDPDTKSPYKVTLTDPATGEPAVDDKGKPMTANDPTKVWTSGQMPNGKWNEWAIFAEDVYKMRDKLVLSLGLRYDVFKVKAFGDTQSNLSPRAALSWIINDKHVVKASYQQGFRTMDYYNRAQTYYKKDAELQYGFRHAAKNVGCDDMRISVDPEKLHSFELNYHGDLFGKILTVDANAFFNRYKSTIDFIKIVDWYGKKSNDYNGPDKIDAGDYYGDYTPTGKKLLTEEQQRAFSDGFFDTQRKKKGKDGNFSAYANNGEDIDIAGFEVIASVSLPTNTNARISYSFASSSTDSYADASIAPKQSIKLGATQKFFEGKLLVSAQYLWEPSIEENEENSKVYSPAYFESRNLLDATIAYRPVSQVMIYALGNNLLGENRPALTYKPDATNNYPQQTQLGCGERRFWLGVKINI